MKSTRKLFGKQASLKLEKSTPTLRIFGTGGLYSPYGGLPLIAKVDRLFSLVRRATWRLCDRRRPGKVDHKLEKLLRQCMYSVVTGNPDTNDADRLRLDPALLFSLGLPADGSGEVLASQASVARFLNERRAEELECMSQWFLDFYLETYSGPKKFTLYFDGTAKETHGRQEGAIYRGGVYGKEMYFPLTVFDQNGALLAAKLRRGDEAEATTVLDVLPRIVDGIRKRWPQAEILVIVDGAFKSPQFLSWCEKNDVFYIAGYPNTHAMKMKVLKQARLVEQKFKRTHGEPRFLGKGGKKKAQAEHERIRRIKDPVERVRQEKELESRMCRRVGEDFHKATTWSKADPERKVIYRLDYTDRGLNARHVVTNLAGYSAEQIYEMYCQRGISEQWIDQLKNCFGLKFNSQSFNANYFRLLIHGLAYTALFLLRALTSKTFLAMSLKSIAKNLVEVAVEAVPRSITCNWYLSKSYSFANEFLRVSRKLEARS